LALGSQLWCSGGCLKAMHPHQLQHFETDPALALRHEQIGQDNAGPEPRRGLEF
jgi:hypothetical protein